MNFYDEIYLFVLIHLKLSRIIREKTIYLTDHAHLYKYIWRNG